MARQRKCKAEDGQKDRPAFRPPPPPTANERLTKAPVDTAVAWIWRDERTVSTRATASRPAWIVSTWPLSLHQPAPLVTRAAHQGGPLATVACGDAFAFSKSGTPPRRARAQRIHGFGRGSGKRPGGHLRRLERPQIPTGLYHPTERARSAAESGPTGVHAVSSVPTECSAIPWKPHPHGQSKDGTPRAGRAQPKLSHALRAGLGLPSNIPGSRPRHGRRDTDRRRSWRVGTQDRRSALRSLWYPVAIISASHHRLPLGCPRIPSWEPPPRAPKVQIAGAPHRAA